MNSLITPTYKRPLMSALLLAGMLSLGTTDANAQDLQKEPEWAFKFTPSWYVTQNENNAADVNLRGNLGQHTTWVGQYVRGNEFQQTRFGYEYSANFSWGQMVPSMQIASKGFVGGSLNFQIGGSTYLLTGLGRTNLKDYYNLTFDPNDSYVIGVGTKVIDKQIFNVFTVRDNRLHTGQTVTHGVWRWQISNSERLVVDASRKSGKLTTDSPAIKGNAISLTYDIGNNFFRLAKEQKVNFTDHDQQRISAGLRF